MFVFGTRGFGSGCVFVPAERSSGVWVAAPGSGRDKRTAASRELSSGVCDI